MTTPHPAAGPRATPQLIFGLLIIAVGVLLTLDNLGVVRADEYLRWWPIGIVAIGLAKIWQSRDGYGGGVGGAILTLVGGWLLLHTIGVIPSLDFAHVWPMVLVIVGATIVWRGIQGRRVVRSSGSTDTITGVALLGALSRASNSRTFKGGELTAIMGGCEIDLRQAGLDGEAVIDVFALWGGIDLRVPEDWTVISRVTPLLGGVDDKTRPPQSAASHRLVLRGFAIMGGVEVKN